MKTKCCYLYDDFSKEYIGESLAYESPLETGIFIAPPNSTYKKPNESKKNKVVCFYNGEWQYFDDFRGEYSFNFKTSEINIINYIGSLKEDCGLIPAKLLNDYTKSPVKYKFINNVLADITDTDEYKTLVSNIGKHLLNLKNGSTSVINEVMFIPDGFKVLEDDIYYEYINKPEIYKIINNELVNISNTEEYKKIQNEKIANLHLTSTDVERALYKAKGIDFDDILEIAQNANGIDIKELKIELKAKDFYRGNPHVDKIGKLLGFSSEQLNNFFKTNNYEYLIT